MLALFKAILMALAGIALGLGATWLALDQSVGLGAVHAGVWRVWPKAGTSEIDPYTRARQARTGEIPLGLAEGLSLTASRDEGGEVLTPRCDYVFSGHIPPARYWTLTQANPEGFLTGAKNIRHNLTSAEIVRRADGDFDIQISASARPGNWLPVSTKDDFMLVLRLYDTAVSATASAIEAGTLPHVARVGCQ